MRAVVVLCLLLLGQAASRANEAAPTIDGFALKDYLGAEHALAEWSDRPVVVVAFLGVECPLAQAYAQRLVQLAGEYGPQGVAFVGIDSNRQDSLAELAHFAKSYKVDFPLLKDPGNKVADLFGAERTPEVFVLDAQRAVRYRGRIDDQFGVGYRRAKTESSWLVKALDELLQGQEVTTPRTDAVGCHIGRESSRPAKGDITYTKHIAGILNAHCVACHRPGQIGPFALSDYDEISGWTATIREVVEQGRMPPWHANPEFGRFANDRRLPDDQKKLLLEWIDNGAPQGDPRDLPEPPRFYEEWAIPKPDLIVSMPEPYTVPAKGVVPYQYFETGHVFDDDAWIQAAEGRPGNRAVVHHMILFFVPPGTTRISPEMAFFNSLAGFVPGMPAGNMPVGVARHVPAGSRLVFQLHYTPNGSEQTDRSSAGLVFADPKTVRKELLTMMALNFQFRIPPGAENYPLEAKYRFEEDMLLGALLPHMHLRGKSFRFDAVYPDGRRETLLDVPRYDFNWQSSYVLAEPKLMPEGSELRCTAVYDNSEKNLVNPDPTQAVMWGDQTWEEMMLGSFEALRADQDLALGPPRVERLDEEHYAVTFSYWPKGEAKAVYLAGSFNDWKMTDHKMDGPDAEGRYTARLVVKPGRLEYKFVIDGTRWRTDPGNPAVVGFYHNSAINVGRP